MRRSFRMAVAAFQTALRCAPPGLAAPNGMAAPQGRRRGGDAVPAPGLPAARLKPAGRPPRASAAPAAYRARALPRQGGGRGAGEARPRPSQSCEGPRAVPTCGKSCLCGSVVCETGRDCNYGERYYAETKDSNNMSCLNFLLRITDNRPRQFICLVFTKSLKRIRRRTGQDSDSGTDPSSGQRSTGGGGRAERETGGRSGARGTPKGLRPGGAPRGPSFLAARALSAHG